MNVLTGKRIFMGGAIAAGLAALAGCASKPPPPPPPPPPVIVIPPQPVPPRGASPLLAVPPRDAFGLRQTVNARISPAQTAWNLRAAYNVAALNCLQPQHAQIVEGYRAFLKAHAKQLTAINRRVDKEFREKHGTRFIPPREAYMTQVYNYFALPPTLPAFCDASLAMSLEAQTVKSADLEAFATRTLPSLDRVFEEFYLSYEQYQTDLAAWRARYMPAPAVSLPPAMQPAAGPAVSAPQPGFSTPAPSASPGTAGQ